jgi:hypothetical protein
MEKFSAVMTAEMVKYKGVNRLIAHGDLLRMLQAFDV